MRLAVRATELSERKDGAILDTLARAHYEKGDLPKAIEVQKEAVAVAPPTMKAQLEEVLKRYARELIAEIDPYDKGSEEEGGSGEK